MKDRYQASTQLGSLPVVGNTTLTVSPSRVRLLVSPSTRGVLPAKTLQKKEYRPNVHRCAEGTPKSARPFVGENATSNNGRVPGWWDVRADRRR